MFQSFPCPKCRAQLEPSGEIVVQGLTVQVFQCDTCTVPWEFDGTVEQAAYTFAVTPNGVAFDPATDDLPESG